MRKQICILLKRSQQLKVYRFASAPFTSYTLIFIEKLAYSNYNYDITLLFCVFLFWKQIASIRSSNQILETFLVTYLVRDVNGYMLIFQVQAAGSTAKAMGANVKLSQAMAETSKTMTNMNKLMNPQQVAKTMQDFDIANTKMGMTEEMMNDALDDILTESGDEEEEDAIVSQVLDEIGIEISGKVILFLWNLITKRRKGHQT